LGTAPRLCSAKTLAEYLRVLRPDGTLVLEEPGAAQARASRRKRKQQASPRRV
jgi:hypothetical protein